MVETKPKVLVVVAAGPLIGVGVAALFAQKGFTHIALLSRNAERLRQDAKDGGLPIGADEKKIIIKTYAADVTIPDSLNSALREVEADFGAPEVVVYNGARVSVVSLSNWDNWTEEDMVTDFRIATGGLYTTAKWAFPLLLTRANSSQPTFIVTSGMEYNNPDPGLFSLSLNKAAQYNLTISLAKTYEPQGIHVGVIRVGGIVGLEEKFFNPANIAERYWSFYSQDKGKWSREIDMKEE